MMLFDNVFVLSCAASLVSSSEWLMGAYALHASFLNGYLL